MGWSFNPTSLISIALKIIVGVAIFGLLSLFYTPGLLTVIVIAACLDTVEVTS